MSKASQEIVCQSKKRFPSMETVLSYIVVIKKTGLMDGYYCNVCEGFHTTTIPGNQKIIAARDEQYGKEFLNKGPKKMRY